MIMPRAEAYGSSFVCHYAEGGATEAYCNRAVCQSVCQSVSLLKKIGFEASFASHGVIWIYTRFVALAGDLDFSEDKSADN